MRWLQYKYEQGGKYFRLPNKSRGKLGFMEITDKLKQQFV